MRQSQFSSEKAPESVKKMPWFLIAPMNQGIFTDDRFSFRITFVNRGNIRIVLPKMLTRTADVREKLSRIMLVQIPDCSG